MDISTQNYNVGERTFVDDTDYSNFSMNTQLIVTARTETTPQAIARLNKDIATLQSKIKSVPFPNGFMGKNVIKGYQNQIADKKKQIDDIKSNGTYCEKNNNCPKVSKSWFSNITNNIANAISSRGGSGVIESPRGGGAVVTSRGGGAIDTPRGGSGAVVVTNTTSGGGAIGGGAIGGGGGMETPQYDSPTTEQPQDTATDDSATDTQTPTSTGMSMNKKYLIGAIVLIGGWYLLKNKK